MAPIRLSTEERKKPLSYDPVTKRFLFIEDIQAGDVRSPMDLDRESQCLLTLKRVELSEPSSIESLEPMSKKQQMDEVRAGSEKGELIVRAEINYVTDTISEIQAGNIV